MQPMSSDRAGGVLWVPYDRFARERRRADIADRRIASMQRQVPALERRTATLPRRRIEEDKMLTALLMIAGADMAAILSFVLVAPSL